MAGKKKKSNKLSVVMPKPNITKATAIVYAVAALVIAIVGLYTGTIMDYACDTHGKFNFNYVNAAMADVSKHIFMAPCKSLLREGSYARSIPGYGLMAWLVFVVYKYSQDPKRTHRKGVEHGSAKWGDDNEKKTLNEDNKTEIIVMKDENGDVMFDENGEILTATEIKSVILSEDVKLSLNTWLHRLNLNILIIGGSGAGKTRFFALPNIMTLSTSFVVTDPKGEILRSTGKMLERAGYKVRVLNLIDMKHSNNYNPFHYVYDSDGNLSEDKIKQMVNTLFTNTKGDGEKDDFWSKKGQTLLESIVYLLFEESEYNAEYDKDGNIKPETRDLSHLNFFSVTEKMRRLQYPAKGNNAKPDGFFMERFPDEPEDDFRARQAEAFLCPLDKDFIELEKRKGDTLAGRLYREIRNAPQETGQSFLTSATVKTFFFNLTNLRNLTCCDNIHLETIGDEKTALFLVIPATDKTYNFVAAMLYTQMFDVLNNRANFKFNGTLPVHVRCIMDEFYNIGEIPNFDVVIGYVRSMGISLNVILQNMAQIKSRYEKTWENITGNCDSLLFLGGKEESTLKYMSEKLGKETIDLRSLNRTRSAKSPSTSESNSIMGRELMMPNEIEAMPIDECILSIKSHNPFYCKKFPLEDHVNYDHLGSSNPNNNFDISEIHSVTAEEYEKQFAHTHAEKEQVATGVTLEKKNEPVTNNETKTAALPANSTDTDAERAKTILDSAFKTITEAPATAESVVIDGIPQSINYEEDDFEVSTDDISDILSESVDDDIEDHFSDVPDETEVFDFSGITTRKEFNFDESVSKKSVEIDNISKSQPNYSEEINEKKEELSLDSNTELTSECLFSNIPYSDNNVIAGGLE